MRQEGCKRNSKPNNEFGPTLTSLKSRGGGNKTRIHEGDFS